MITVRRSVPEIYYNESRDFQFIGRVFETVFNNTKTGVDLLLNNPYSKNMDSKLVDLLAKTVGFDTKHKYTTTDLKIVCSCFKEIMKKKGSKEAIDILVRALLKSQNIKKGYVVDIFTTEENLPDPENVPGYFESFTAVIQIPYELKDKVIIEDVLDYILPAGCDYRIIRASINDMSSDPSIARITTDSIDQTNVYLESGDDAASHIGANVEVASVIS